MIASAVRRPLRVRTMQGLILLHISVETFLRAFEYDTGWRQ